MNQDPIEPSENQPQPVEQTSTAAFDIRGRVLVKNNQFLIINKPAGLPTQPGRVEGPSLIALAERYIGHPLHLVHRIDQAASGVVLLAQTASSAARLNNMLQQGEIVRTYWAVVSGELPSTQGELTDWMVHDKRTNKSTLVEEGSAGALKAVLQYKLLGSSDRYHLVEVQLTTGRPHQIRTQLAARGCFIKGDVKYGARRANSDRSIHLLARNISFNHPISGQQTHATAPLPEEPLWDYFATQVENK
jgi:23S rRNA pseudouridine1911/1915/1917 synthase